ncbi:hypothetical protein ACQKMI_13285 [Lysinibacillus sp. NPDC097214]|uniref:hypothetical protein n=1 Tax=Lysinibacillus sp. NPDC097214 TaxID=3390584 RepID=UPI003D082AF8
MSKPNFGSSSSDIILISSLTTGALLQDGIHGRIVEECLKTIIVCKGRINIVVSI